MAFGPDGTLLAASTGHGTFRLWNVTARGTAVRATVPASPDGAVGSLAFSPDGPLLAARTAGGTVRVWNVATRDQVTAPLLANDLSEVAFGPDNTTLVAGRGTGVGLWDAGTGQEIGTLPAGDPGAGLWLAVSPKNALLASGTYAGRVQLWSIPNLTGTVSYLCALAGQPFPPAQWPNDAPGLPYMATCP